MYTSAWSTPEGSMPRIHAVESSPLSHDNMLDFYDDLTSAMATEGIPRANVLIRFKEHLQGLGSLWRSNSRAGYKTTASYRLRFRNHYRLLLLMLFVMVSMCMWFNRGQRYRHSMENEIGFNTKINLEGLQFIDADHPYIRVCSLYLFAEYY